MAYIGPSFIRANKGDLVVIKFTLTVADVPTNLTTPTLSAYEEGNATEFTGGITLTAPYDSKVGLNELQIDTSDAAYTAGKQYAFVFTAGTIGAVTLVGTAILNLALIPEPADLRAVNGGSTGATAGKLELSKLTIAAIAEPAVDLSATANDDAVVKVVGTDTGALELVSSGSTDAIYIEGGKNGITVYGDAGDGIQLNGGSAGPIPNAGMAIYGPAATVDAPGGEGLVIFGGGANATKRAGPGIAIGGGWSEDGAVKAGNGIEINSGRTSGDGLSPDAALVIATGDFTNTYGVHFTATDAPALFPIGGSDAIKLTVDSTGKAINALGQVYIAVTGNSVSAVELSASGNGTGVYPTSYSPAAGLYIHSDGDSDAVTIADLSPSGYAGIDAFSLKGRGVYIESVEGESLYITQAGNNSKPAVQITGAFAGGGKPAGPAVWLNGGYGSSGMGELGAPALFILGGYDPTHGSGPAILAIADTESGDTPAEAHVQIGVNSSWLQAIYDFIDNPGPTDALMLESAGAGKALNALGQVLIAPTNTDDSALVLTPNGAGLGIDCPVETGADLIESLMLANAANAGKTNGMGTATAHLRDLADTKNRVTATLDANGDRVAVTRDLT